MSPIGTAYIQSLAALADSAQRLAAAVESGDWDTVTREIPENSARFVRLSALAVDAPAVLDRSQRARAEQLISQIVAANERAVGRISPRLADMKQLLSVLSA